MAPMVGEAIPKPMRRADCFTMEKQEGDTGGDQKGKQMSLAQFTFRL